MNDSLTIDLSKFDNDSRAKHYLATVSDIFTYLQNCNANPALTENTCFVGLLKSQPEDIDGGALCEVCGNLELATALCINAIRDLVNCIETNNVHRAETFSVIAEMFSSYAKECKEQHK